MLKIRIKNFRGISEFYGIPEFEWSPEGVSVLVGGAANDVFDALYYMSLLILRSVEDGLEIPEDVEGFFGVASSWHTVELSVTVDRATWTAQITLTHQDVLRYEEAVHLTHPDGTTEALTIEPECGLYSLYALERLTASQLLTIGPLLRFFRDLRVYSAPYNLREGWVPLAASRWDLPPGWAVQCPIEHTRLVTEVGKAFPDRRINLVMAASAHYLRRHSPGVAAAVGYLFHAISSSEGSVIAFEDFGQGLHPHAIRSILTSLRELAEEREQMVLLTTTSPVVLNNLASEEVHVLVPGKRRDTTQKANPQCVVTLYPPETLGGWSLGTLYEQTMFGS